MKNIFYFSVSFISFIFIFLSFQPFIKSSFASELVINEFLPNPPSGSPEWVEFYNTSSASIDLSDYYFDDDVSFDSDTGSSAKIALSGILPASQTCYWDLSSYLNNNGDSPTLFKVENNISTTVDIYSYSSSSAELTYARIPDGGSWNTSQQPTKASAKCLDLAPTSTPTPTSTPVPTNTPTPTSAPTSTPTNTPIPTKTPTPTLKPSPTPTRIAVPTRQVIPTLVLGESTKNEFINLPTDVAKNLENNLIATENKKPNSNLQKIFIVIGGVLLMACAILSFRFLMKDKQQEEV
ncbi:MAG: lamin tail domain-containing protein [Candidatus Levybacteria bacterium]|nr:lamin tail domain-containing protein [Candidatus Levybacteria bacterium]